MLSMLFLIVGFLGCGQSHTANGEKSTGEPVIQGEIAEIKDDRFLVESTKRNSSYRAIWFSADEIELLKVGQLVSVWTSEVAESDPAQAHAEKIEIIEYTDEDQFIFKSLENPLKSYYTDTLYEDHITLDATEAFQQYAKMKGSDVEAIHTLIHVKLTDDLKMVDTEGNHRVIEEIEPNDIVYLDFDFSDRQNQEKFKGNEAKIETDLLIVVKERSSIEKDNWEPTMYNDVNTFDEVTMMVKEGTVSSTELTVRLQNNSDKEVLYGEGFALEKKIDEQWVQVPDVLNGNYGFNDIGYTLASSDMKEWTVDWEWLYGSLDPGEYRFVKEVLDFREAGDYDTHVLTAEYAVE